MALNPDIIAERALNDLKDFLQRCWKMASDMPRFDRLIEEQIREHLAKNTELPNHQQDFFIAALNAAKAERTWRRDYQECDKQIEYRDQQDRHAEAELPEVG